MMSLVSVAVTMLVISSVPPADAGGTLSPLPWHLADVHQLTREEVLLQTLSVEVYLFDDVPTGFKLFIVPLNAFTLHRTEMLPLYLGQKVVTPPLERRVFPPDSVYKYHPAGFCFTRWGDMERASIRPARDGLYEHDNYEGAFARASVVYPWKKGKYTYRLVREETESTIDGVFTWAAGFVTVHNTGETVHIGSLRFPGDHIRLGQQFCSFVEVFGLPDESPRSIPPLRLAVGNWRLNGYALPVHSNTRTYNKGVPQVAEVKTIRQFLADGECDESADLPRGNDAVGIVIRSKPIQRQSERTILWSAKPGVPILPLPKD